MKDWQIGSIKSQDFFVIAVSQSCQEGVLVIFS